MIQELLDNFVRLDAEFSHQIATQDFDSAVQTAFAAAQIRMRLRWLLALSASAIESEPLRQFVEKRFCVQNYIDQLGLAEDGPDGTEEWDRFGYLADPHLNHVMDLRDPDWPTPINARLLKIAVLVTPSPLPDWVLRHLRSVRQCFALELWDMVWISLRALIEAACFARLQSAGVVRHDVRDLAERNVRWCLNEVGKLGDVPPRELKAIHGIITRANSVVHAKREVRSPSEAETFKAVEKVIQLVAILFRAAEKRTG